jgi:hypothetical protein
VVKHIEALRKVRNQVLHRAARLNVALKRQLELFSRDAFDIGIVDAGRRREEEIALVEDILSGAPTRAPEEIRTPASDSCSDLRAAGGRHAKRQTKIGGAGDCRSISRMREERIQTISTNPTSAEK